jgi:hypothetical protein
MTQIESWMTTDQDKFARFESLVLVTQRATFVKAVLGMTDGEEIIGRYMRRVCERHGIEFRQGRGPGYDGRHLRHADIPQRYICSLLLCWLLQSSDGGIADTGDGLDPQKLLDRMLYCYRHYLNLFMTTAARADVSFEMFYTLYQSNAVGDIQLHLCENCGAQFVLLRTAHAVTCPVCAIHHHARSPARRHRPLKESTASPARRSNP